MPPMRRCVQLLRTRAGIITWTGTWSSRMDALRLSDGWREASSSTRCWTTAAIISTRSVRSSILSSSRSLLLLLGLLLHLFNDLFSGTTWISRYQKGKTSEARDDGVWGWQWHEQTVCTSLQTDDHTNGLNFYRPCALPDAQLTVSKHWNHIRSLKYSLWHQQVSKSVSRSENFNTASKSNSC